MAATAALTVGGTVVNLPSGNVNVTAVWNAPAAVGEIINYSLTTGDNQIDVPAGASFALITPPLNNSALLCLKGTGSDFGVTFAPTPAGTSMPLLLCFQSGQTSFIINASAPVTGITTVLFC